MADRDSSGARRQLPATIAVQHDKTLYRERYRIENMFGHLKGWRRVATCHDRCADIFLSTRAFAAVILF